MSAIAAPPKWSSRNYSARAIGILGMKSLRGGLILHSQYDRAFAFRHDALNFATSAVITGIESKAIFDQASDGRPHVSPLRQSELEGLLAETAPLGIGGRFERFQTTLLYNAAAQNRHWTGEGPDHVRGLKGCSGRQVSAVFQVSG